MNSGSSAFIGSAGQTSDAPSSTSSYHLSRPFAQPTLPPVCFTTTTCSTFVPRTFFSASSTLAFKRDLLAAAHAFVGRDHDARRAVFDAALQCFGREAAEHDRVDRADTRAREHRDRGLGNHRHVDRDAVAFLDAEALQRVRELADALVQLAIADEPRRGVRIVGLPEDRGLLGALREMPVEAVGRDVELAVGEPANVQVLRVEARVFDLRERLAPREPLAGLLGPERFRVRRRSRDTSRRTWQR